MSLECTLNFSLNNQPISLPITLTDDQVEAIKAAIFVPSELSGWDEPKIGQRAYYEDAFNEVASFEITADSIGTARELYESDNFFSTEEAAKNAVRADNVLRRIRHYAINHRKRDTNMAEGGYTITYNYYNNCLEIGATGQWLALGDMVFDTEEIARKAMNKYASDLIWYFTEGKAMM